MYHVQSCIWCFIFICVNKFKIYLNKTIKKGFGQQKYTKQYILRNILKKKITKRRLIINSEKKIIGKGNEANEEKKQKVKIKWKK